MRYLTVPKKVEVDGVLDNRTGKPMQVSFADFLRVILIGHKDVTKDDASIRMFMELSEEVKDASPGDVLSLNNEQHEFFSTLARTHDYSPGVKLSVMPHIRAVTMSPAKNPDEEEDEEEDDVEEPVIDESLLE